MRVIRTWNCLEAFGIIPLTTAFGRFGTPCDVTALGKQLLETAFDVEPLVLRAPCKPGSPDCPHVGSIMLGAEMLPFLALQALCGDGATEIVVTSDGRYWALYPHENGFRKRMFFDYYRDDIVAHIQCNSASMGRLSDYRSHHDFQ